MSQENVVSARMDNNRINFKFDKATGELVMSGIDVGFYEPKVLTEDDLDPSSLFTEDHYWTVSSVAGELDSRGYDVLDSHSHLLIEAANSFDYQKVSEILDGIAFELSLEESDTEWDIPEYGYDARLEIERLRKLAKRFQAL